MIKVSVIIPVYNAERYLKECLDSVINQTLRELEVICINDGSTDNSLDIIMLYQRNYNNIKIISQNNYGAAVARNKGIEEAQGEFVTFMDSDDFYPSNDILEVLYNKTKESQVDIGGGSICYFAEGAVHNRVSEADAGSIFVKEQILEYKEYQYAYGFTRFIYKIDTLKRYNIRFPLYKCFEDPPFMVHAMIAAKKLYSTPKEVYCIRRGDRENKYINEAALLEIAKGLQHLLCISLENNLVQLYRHTTNIIFKSYAMRFYGQILKGSNKIENEIEKINKLLDKGAEKFNEPLCKLLQDYDLDKLVEKKNKVLHEFIMQIDKYEYIIIYGAGIIGRETYDYICKNIKKDSSKIKFAVTNLKDNMSTARGKKISEIDDLLELRNCSFVVIAVQDKYYNEIYYNLELKGFKKIIKIDLEALRLLS